MADGANKMQTSVWHLMASRQTTTFVPEQYLLNTTDVTHQYLPNTTDVTHQYLPNTTDVTQQYLKNTTNVTEQYPPDISNNVTEQELRLMLLGLMVPGWRVVLSACVCATVTVLGVPGNLLVIRVFWPKRHQSAANLYILAMGCLDCLVCGVFVPLLPVFISRWHGLHTYMIWLKRIWTLFMIHNTLFSLYLLDLIALDRTRTICQSLKARLSHNCAIGLMVGGFIICLVLAWMSLMVIERQVSLPLIKVLTVPQATGITIIIMAYGRIFFFLRRQNHTVNPGFTSSPPHQVIASETSAGPLVNVGGTNPGHNVATSSSGPLFIINRDLLPTHQPCPHRLCKSGHQQAYRANPRRRHLAKTALTLGVVTLIFILTYLPVYVAAPVLNIKPYSFYTYLLNYVANPFIYYFMNKGFNAEVKKFCRVKLQISWC